MVSTRFARVVVVALTVSATAQASWLAVPAEEAALVERQDTNSSSLGGVGTLLPTPSQSSPTVDSTPTPSPTSPQTTPSSTPTQQPDTTTNTSPTGGNTSPTGGNTSPSSTPSSTAPSSSGPVTTSSSSRPPKTTAVHTISSGQDLSSFSSFSTATSTTVEAITTTDGAGNTLVTSATKVSTQTYGLSVGDVEPDTNQGVSPQQKNVIIGVCVGVGGAIVLAVGGLMYWRLRNKRRQEVDQDELQSFGTPYGAPGTSEKNDNVGGARSPFQSTLESYHAPSQANTASNF